MTISHMQCASQPHSCPIVFRLAGAPRPVYNWTLDLVNGSITAEVFGPVQPDHVVVSSSTTLPGSCKAGVEPCVPRRDFRLINGDTEWNPCPYIPGES